MTRAASARAQSCAPVSATCLHPDVPSCRGSAQVMRCQDCTPGGWPRAGQDLVPRRHGRLLRKVKHCSEQDREQGRRPYHPMPQLAGTCTACPPASHPQTGPEIHCRRCACICALCTCVSVEELDQPALKDKPMAVGGMGMICTANYAARKFGVRSAMPGFIAKKLCPQVRTLTDTLCCCAPQEQTSIRGSPALPQILTPQTPPLPSQHLLRPPIVPPY